MTRRAVLISNVKHVRHQLQALVDSGFDTHFLGVRLFSPKTVERLGAVPLTRPISGLLQRRQGEWPSSIRFHGLGPGTYTPLIQGRLHLGDSPNIATSHVRLQRGMVRWQMRRIGEPKIVHSVEGLGMAALATASRSTRVIVERRSLHPADMAEPMTAHGNFPIDHHAAGVAKPLGDEFSRSDAIVVYSELAKASLISHGIPSDKLWVVPIPVDVPRSLPKPNTPAPDATPRFLFVGACQIYKGIDVAAAAVATFRGAANLRIAGYATDSVSSWLRAQDHVRYLGIRSQGEIQVELSQATALIMPSKESLGLAILEAIRARVPCLISDQSGIAPTLKRHAPECVVEGREPADWYEKLDWISRLSTEERENLTMRSFQSLLEFTYEKSVSAQCAVYEHIAS